MFLPTSRSTIRPIPALPRFAAAAIAALQCAILCAPARVAAEDTDVVAVYASVSPDYHREKNEQGKFRAETYAFGQGGYAPGTIKDPTIDNMSFLDVARTIAPALAVQNYIPRNPNDPPERTNLLIMVYWGTTVGTDDTSKTGEYKIAESLIPPPITQMAPPPDNASDPAMVRDPTMSGRAQLGAQIAAVTAAADSQVEQSVMLSQIANRRRDRLDRQNATLLGFLPELQRVDGYANTPLANRRNDILGEIEESRYYVVLLAYDFPLLLQHKQRKLLWEARFSIGERRNGFRETLARMAQTASAYFGQNSDGLKHRPMPVPNVTVGPLRIIEDTPPARK